MKNSKILIESLCEHQLLNNNPTLYKYPLKESLIRRALILTNRSKIININNYFWHTALLTIGNEKDYKVTKDNSIIIQLNKFYTKILKKKLSGYKTVQVVDQIMNLYTLLYLKYELNYNEYDELIVEGLDFIDNAYNKCKVIPYRNSNKELILIDTLGMICPFLMRYSYYSKDMRYYKIAVNQLKDFINNGIDKESYFPYHSYNLVSNKNSGSSEWGRGIGWMLIGFVDSMEYMDRSDNDYIMFKEYLNNFIPQLIKYQDEDGYFKCHVKDSAAHIDSSATAFIGYSIARAIELKILDEKYLNIVNKCCNAILMSMDDKGRIWDCSEDCGGIGKYSMKFSCNLANGISLALISVYEQIQNYK